MPGREAVGSTFRREDDDANELRAVHSSTLCALGPVFHFGLDVDLDPGSRPGRGCRLFRDESAQRF